MKEIDVPQPGCKSCAKRKARSNPYERVQNIAGWVGMLAIPVLLLGVIAAYVLMVMWGIDTGQYGSTEVTQTQTVDVPNNNWIGLVTVLGGLLGGAGILFAFIAWGMSIKNRWERQSLRWDREKRIED